MHISQIEANFLDQSRFE